MKTQNTHKNTDILMSPQDRATAQAVLRTLDAQTGQYDVATQMQLNEARAKAIAATRANVPFWRRRSIFGAAFALSSALAFIVLTQPAGVTSSAEIEATALFEATFGAEPPEAVAANPEAFFVAELDQIALDETGLDEAVVANDLEFYAWLSESTNADRARGGSGS